MRPSLLSALLPNISQEVVACVKHGLDVREWRTCGSARFEHPFLRSDWRIELRGPHFNNFVIIVGDLTFDGPCILAT